MKLPRDIDAKKLVNLLSRYGYQISRQTGSHIRLTTSENGEHHTTIPLHNPLRVGTLNGIISDVASHQGKSKEMIIQELFK